MRSGTVMEIGQVTQQKFRIELAVSQPDMVGIDKGELPARASVVHRQAGSTEMVPESGLSVIKGAATAFLPAADAGSQIARQRPQPIFLIGEKLADMNAVIKAILPEIRE